MKSYEPTTKEIWSGRNSYEKLYLHEKIECVDLEKDKEHIKETKSFGILGYACDEGVKRNQGRIGAVEGPDAIRNALGKLPNHILETTSIIDYGTICCLDGNMEKAQKNLSQKVTHLLNLNTFPILFGGGHDIAYAHYNGIKNHVGSDKKIGIINFDAHFDLRSNQKGSNSGTPFYEIAQDCKKEGAEFKYLCLGIRKDANDRQLFETANKLGVEFIENYKFSIENAEIIVRKLLDFLRQIDHAYITIDLDGFSSAYAPGVSAPSAMGFSPNMVLKSLEVIIASRKLISFDIAELNPTWDIDNRTSKLAASLVHFVLSQVAQA